MLVVKGWTRFDVLSFHAAECAGLRSSGKYVPSSTSSNKVTDKTWVITTNGDKDSDVTSFMGRSVNEESGNTGSCIQLFAQIFKGSECHANWCRFLCLVFPGYQDKIKAQLEKLGISVPDDDNPTHRHFQAAYQDGVLLCAFQLKLPNERTFWTTAEVYHKSPFAVDTPFLERNEEFPSSLPIIEIDDSRIERCHLPHPIPYTRGPIEP